MKKLKSTLYPLLLVALFLGLVSLGLGLFQLTVWIEPPSPDTAALPKTGSPPTPAAEGIGDLPAALPSVPPASPTPIASPTKSTSPTAIASGQGTLRVGNPTEHPVRIVLTKVQSKGYGEPAHWDFAPGEGGAKG